MEPKAIIEAIKAIPPALRVTILEEFCPSCGRHDSEPRCYCSCEDKKEPE
jgi:hypothetical protein